MNKRFMPLIRQISRFGIVGLTAAAVHYTTVVSVVTYTGMHPLMANIIGFIVGFQVSYSGHRLWTFRESLVAHREAYPKLLLVQAFNFIGNELLFFLFLEMNLPYKLALVIVLTILPIFTFLMNKFWVFV